ncbi:MAG TPA: DUF4097 family beta strand repeat-containing protein [Terriglobales bacterium]|nr:DUF4097 family beta strand repeat-containing protein [Terriglobales bacterium]
MLRTTKIFVLAILALLFAGLFLLAAADYREEFSKTLPLKAGQTFSLENVNGRVTVTTWKEDRVEIKAVKVARDDEKDLKDVEIRIEESAGKVSVKAIWPKFRTHFNVHVNFDVKAPEGVDLKTVETVNGDVEASGAYGSAELETTNGSVTADGVKGSLSVTTTNGGITVRRQEGRLEAETTNGGIRLERLTFKDGIRAETTNGSISLAIESPGEINADLVAETTNGHVSVDFPVTLQNLRQSRHRVEAKIGRGGPEIQLTTTNGSISITK